MTAQYLLHGLVIESELRLPARSPDERAPPQLRVVLGGPPPGPEAPGEGEIVADLAAYGYSAVRSGDTLRCWFSNLAEFIIDTASGEVRVGMSPCCDRELASLLFAGTVLSLVLALRDKTVLHASAVRHEGVTLAFVGDEGRGKSTLATLLCADGAELVTDDVLRFEVKGNDVHWYSGTNELRLRRQAWPLASNLPYPSSPTSDGRLRLDLASRCAPTRGKLDAIILPRPDTALTQLESRVVSAPDALLALAFSPRLRGLCDIPALRRQFHALGALVRRVPVLDVALPWGPPFAEQLSAELCAVARAGSR